MTMHLTQLVFTLISIATLTNAAVDNVGMFRVICFDKPLSIERADPIVNLGNTSSHIHTIFGSNGFSKDATNADLKASTCTTCNTAADKSAYWFPTLYVDSGTGFKNVETSVKLYYSNPGKTKAANIEPFPEGFRMIAGDKDRRDSAPSISGGKNEAANRIVEFQCVNYRLKSEKEQPHYATFQAAWKSGSCEKIRGHVYFPRCWDGKNVDSPDHKSHVAYPTDGKEGRNCPPSHPKYLAVFRIVAEHDVKEYMNKAMPKFMYSMGDYSLNGLHADFMNGWDSEFFMNAISKCNLGNLLEKCDVLTMAPGYKTVKDYQNNLCEGKVTVPEEVVGEALTMLPLARGSIKPGGPADVLNTPTAELNVVPVSTTAEAAATTSVAGTSD